MKAWPQKGQFLSLGAPSFGVPASGVSTDGESMLAGGRLVEGPSSGRGVAFDFRQRKYIQDYESVPLETAYSDSSLAGEVAARIIRIAGEILGAESGWPNPDTIGWRQKADRPAAYARNLPKGRARGRAKGKRQIGR